jgi:hypothetical protein
MSDLDQYIAPLMRALIPNEQAALAEKLRRQKQAEQLSGANTQAHALDMTNFAAGLSNNEALAKSMETLTGSTQKRYKPVQLGQTGFMLPETGEFSENPVYVDQKEQDRTSKLASVLQVAQAAKDRAAAHDVALRQIAAGNNQTRLLAAAIAAGGRSSADDKAAADREKRDEKDIQSLSERYTRGMLPSIVGTTRKLAELAASDKPIPGIGYGTEIASKIPILSDILVGSEGKTNRALVQSLSNDLLKLYSGAAITLNEGQRRALEQMSSGSYSEKDFRNALRDVIIPKINEMQQGVVGGFRPEVVQEYSKRSGLNFTPIEMKTNAQAAKGADSVPPASGKQRLKFNPATGELE